MPNKDGARSYKTQVIGDSMSVTINFKWLIQLIVVVSMAVYGFWKLEDRIGQLEDNLESAMTQLLIIEDERKIEAANNLADLQEQLGWYERELNLNPFSWGKKKKKQMPNRKAKDKKMFKKRLNKWLNRYGRTKKQLENYKKKHGADSIPPMPIF